MNLRPTADQELLRRTVREFAEAEIRPCARELGDAVGWKRLSLVPIHDVEELARVDPSVALSVAAHNGLCVAHLARFFRDVKLCTIGEGTSVIQDLVVARAPLGH